MTFFRPAAVLLVAALFAAPAAWADASALPTGPLPPGQAEVEAGETAREAKQYAAALAAFEKAAALNNTDALTDLGELHEKGWGVPRDMGKAAAWYEKAAKLGDPYAKYKVKCDLVGREAKWKELLKKAEGDGEAARQVGDAYFFGAPLAEQDEKEAAKWYEKAAAKGDGQAACNLGLMSEYGFGVKQDDKAAMGWYEKGQAAGSAEAPYRMGGLYLRGDGVEVDMAKAIELFTASAEAGSPLGMRMMGLCCREGMGVGKDRNEAVRWQEKAGGLPGIIIEDSNYYGIVNGIPASGPQVREWLEGQAKAGNIAAMGALGQASILPNSSYGVLRDVQQGLTLMTHAAKRGNANAMNTLGNQYCRDVSGAPNMGIGTADFQISYVLWMMAARQKEVLGSMGMNALMAENLARLAAFKTSLPLTGEHVALWWKMAGARYGRDLGLSMAYRHGMDILPEDAPALGLCMMLARAGDVEAMVDFGAAYAQGAGVPKDESKAFAWFYKAAKKDPWAAGLVGYRYSIGRGVPHDEKLAAQWLFVGAKAGERRALRLLGNAYFHGAGVAKDSKMAMEWYAKAYAFDPATYGRGGSGYGREYEQMAMMYCEGIDVPKDVAKVDQVPQNQGGWQCAYLRACIKHRGWGGPKDYAKAIEKYSLASVVLETELARQEMAFKGQGMPKDDAKAVPSLRYNGELPLYPLFCHNRATMLLHGRGIERAPDAAVGFFLGAAYLGDGFSESNLSLMFNNDMGDLAATREKRDTVLKAARTGDAKAMARLGEMYWLGQGVSIDREQAERWLYRAASTGHGGAECAVGSLHASPVFARLGDADDGRRDYQRRLSIHHFQKAAALNSPRAMFCLGYAHEHGLGVPKDLEKSVAWYAKGAAAGDTFAMIAIAELAKNGAVGDADNAKALRWYTAAADKGNLLAMRVLADAYRTGGWTGADGKWAFAWYEKAAAKNDPEAMFRLGLALRQGTTVVADDAKATAWYAKAAELGHSGAMRNLGAAYRDGKGVKEDAKTAWAWFELAARDLAKNAADHRDALGAQMTEAQVAEAKTAADALGKKIWPDR